MDEHQYRITVNGTAEIYNQIQNPISHWNIIASVCEERGYPATFERRLITDKSYLEYSPEPGTYYVMGEKVICRWETIAQVQ